MCDMDSGSDFDVSLDVGSDVGSDYESDIGSDSSFEGLDSVDDTNFESFDDLSDVNSDIGSDVDFESFFDKLDSVDDASYETVDVESENDYAESVEDVEVLDSLESLSDDNDLELLENGTDTETDLSSLDDVELLTNEQVEIENENGEAAMDITDLENTDIEESLEPMASEVSSEDLEMLIENTNDIEQLNELRASLVNAAAEHTLTEDIESLEEIENVSENEEQTDADWDQLTLNELSDDIPYSEPDVVVTENEVQEFIDSETNTDRLEALRDSLLSGEIAVETDETADDDSPKVLTREITPEIIESRERDTKETLENYRDNLREYGVTEEQTDQFVEQEREKIKAEYESLDRGDTSSNIYYQPTDWEEVANSLTVGQSEQISDDISNELDVEQESEQTNTELQELNINYDEIYEGIQQEALEESFADIHIDADHERLDNSLENFNVSTWDNLTLDEQKGSVSDIGGSRLIDTKQAYEKQIRDYESPKFQLGQEISNLEQREHLPNIMSSLENSLERRYDEVIESENAGVDLNNKIDSQLNLEDNTGVIRDLLVQNINKQKLPSSDRIEWLDEGTSGETACRVRDDALIKVHDKSTNTDIIYSGSEFKEYMLDKYGTDIVNYSHREPDFEPFEQVFSSNRVNEFMEKKYGSTMRNITNWSVGNVYLEHMDTERNGNGTFAKANQEIATRLGISKTDVAEYMKENNLTWHECGDRHTIRAVPSEINQVFGHTGGIGLQQDLQALSESTRRTVGDRILLQREAVLGTADGLERAINSKHRQNRAIKKELFGKK